MTSRPSHGGLYNRARSAISIAGGDGRLQRCDPHPWCSIRMGDGARLGPRLGGGCRFDRIEGMARVPRQRPEFAAACIRRFDLIETMRFDPVDGILLLDRHPRPRLAASAATLGFAARPPWRAQRASSRDNSASPARPRVRLMLAPLRAGSRSRPGRWPPATGDPGRRSAILPRPRRGRRLSPSSTRPATAPSTIRHESPRANSRWFFVDDQGLSHRGQLHQFVRRARRACWRHRH